ncbi:rhomboid family intramembrane serine protease GlpG [Alteromonas sediminis]|uniref:Rhomboid family intramembrane serine protease GlpG n=1 Tax=Alteromonas sediminis TaxID=2259342 RepID=A0A3N5Y5D3_9ALTE|nr:rhomboid family intramembrane serine protease GlpG [Alteromonas sediminis]RPJ65449.1 rhomboid family intramembrane serine protease GlpG [Alteromonas sediminis]
MKLVGFASQPTALLLANYLRKQGIAVEVNEDASGTFVLHLVDSAQADKAMAITQEFVSAPTHPKYQQAAWDSSEQVSLVKSGASAIAFNPKQLLGVPFTSLVLLTCAAIYLLSLFGGFEFFANALMITPFSQLTESGQWWRLVGPALIHFSALHIVFNLLWWWILGAPIENKFGTSFLVIFMLITATVSNVAQLVVSGPNFGGLSGVVYALMGFVWWVGWLKPQWGLSLPKHLVGFMLVWLVLGFADVLWVSMANTAHTAGLVSGCLFALLLTKLSKR